MFPCPHNKTSLAGAGWHGTRTPDPVSSRRHQEKESKMIAETGMSPQMKIGLHLGCLLRGNLFRLPKARFHWSAIKRAIKDALSA